jgi:hypothetical protein
VHFPQLAAESFNIKKGFWCAIELIRYTKRSAKSTIQLLPQPLLFWQIFHPYSSPESIYFNIFVSYSPVNGGISRLGQEVEVIGILEGFFYPIRGGFVTRQRKSLTNASAQGKVGRHS